MPGVSRARPASPEDYAGGTSPGPQGPYGRGPRFCPACGLPAAASHNQLLDEVRLASGAVGGGAQVIEIVVRPKDQDKFLRGELWKPPRFDLDGDRPFMITAVDPKDIPRLIATSVLGGCGRGGAGEGSLWWAPGFRAYRSVVLP